MHNRNVTVLFYATALDISMMAYYFQSWPIDLYVIFGCFVPLLLNIVFLCISYENKLKSISNFSYLSIGYSVVGIFAMAQFGMVIYLMITLFANESIYASASFQMGSMWLTENFFLCLVFTVNILQLYSFTKHVHTYRRFCVDQLVLSK